MLLERLLLLLVFICVSTVSYAGEFVLSSPEIDDNTSLSEEQVYKGFGCLGQNSSPALVWSGAPEGTKTYAITVFDPDAPTGSGWWHWLVYNIPSHVGGVVAGAGTTSGDLLPLGAIQGRSDYGEYTFGGACPPQGEEAHRYVFTVHALKSEKLDVPKDASAALISFLVNANSLGKASITATYGRK
jgi:Raf kinase inhibitor-like YbhB/YbcL family protein